MTVIVLFSILLIGSASYGLLYMYVNQPALPKNVHVGEMLVEGKNRKNVLHELDEQIQKLEDWPVTFEVTEPNPQTMSYTAAQVGVSYNVNSLESAIQQLEEGNLWERAYARYHFPKEFSLDMTYNSRPLQGHLSPAWEKKPLVHLRTLFAALPQVTKSSISRKRASAALIGIHSQVSFRRSCTGISVY